MGGTRLLVTGAALAVTLAGAMPAQAAVAGPDPEPIPEMILEIATKEVTPGTSVVITGVAGYLDRTGGNAGRVDFYFTKGQSGVRTHLGSTGASSAGRFRWATKATVSGDYTAEYRHLKQEITATATEALTVYTTRTTDQMLYSWTASRLSCLPSCKTIGPEQFVDSAPIHVELSRECLQPKSGGRIGFAAGKANAFQPGSPAWRDFPEGRGPAAFDLKPGVTKGRFYFEWTSAPAPAGELTSCNLSFTASQKVLRREYL